MALIQANRESIDDRFSVLGFTVRTETPLFEVVLAAHPDLLKPANRAKRTSSNFFTSRLLAGARRGEAVYLVPPNVVARFVGQPRLYFGLATYGEGDRSNPVSVKIPDTGSMYVNTSGLTERGLRRTARGNGAVSYGNGGEVLAWGGDAVVMPATDAAPAARKGNGNGGAPTSGTAAPYSDGYSDDLWKQDSAAAQPATLPANGASSARPTPTPTIANGSNGTSGSNGSSAGSQAPPVTSQNYRGTRARSLSAPPRARELLVEPYDQPSSWWDALTTQIGHFARGAMWFLGVVDTTQPPYSAICQVRRPDGSAEGAHMGTAFFIGPRLLLTAAHVVDGQSELIIVPGKNGGGTGGTTEPFGRFRTTQFRKHGSYGVNGSDNDMALICVPAANAAASPNYFRLVEELTQSRSEGVVVSGYAAWWHATSAIEEFVNANIDENRQHAHGGHIRDLPTDGTFTYDLQTLAGTSGSPVYWIEDGATPTAHLVGVHVAANDNRTNLGCRVTQEKLRWIRDVAAGWGQTLTFSLAVRALNDAATVVAEVDPDTIGITEDEPVIDAATAVAQNWRTRALDAPAPDYPGASRFVPAHSNNFTRGRRRDRVVDRVVIHITAGGPSIEGTIAWMQNGERVNKNTGKPIRSSAHYIVGRDGEVVQMVRNADTAHHASQANSRSVGIEHNGNKPSRHNARDLPPTEPQYEASARLVAWLCQQLGIPADREHIRGHMEISPADDHDCPSSIWDWDHYMACVHAAVAALAAPTSQSLSAWQRTPARTQTTLATSVDTFEWPSVMSEGNYITRAFVEAYNTRHDNERAKSESLSGVATIRDALKSDSGRQDVGRAILEITMAGALQVFDLIKDRLPPTFYAEITTDVRNPPPTPSETFAMPRVMPHFSQRVGMFMAWVDGGIQQATFDTAERVAYQKGEWDQMMGIVGAASTMMGMVPGLGTAMTFIGLVLQGVLTAAKPDFDAEYTSFEAAMQAIRAKYKALAGAALEGLIHAKLGPQFTVDIPPHADIQAYLDAHSAHALRGWQNELVYLGVGTPATGLSFGLQRVTLSRAQEIITPFYDPADPATALTCQADAFSLAREEWFSGVPNTTIFPHSAICLLEMKDASGGVSRGTGFYIGRNRILTCAHNLWNMASVDIIPGKNGQGSGTEPFGRCTVSASSWRIPASYGGSNAAFDLAVIDVPLAAPNGGWFPVLEELNQSRPEGVVVCGYSSRSPKVPELTAIIDGFKQHLHAGYIAQLGPGDSTFSYPILTLKRASGSPVYYISDKDGTLKAYIVGVHTGSDTDDLNRGCRLSAAKIDWIEGRTATLSAPLSAGPGRARANGARTGAWALSETADEDSLRGIEGPIPDDVATAQTQGARARALDAPSSEYPQAARFVPAHSGNYRASASPRAIDCVVIHITDGGANINGTIGWFQNPAAKVSAHYVIGQDGEVVQMVRHNDVAWHARSANRTSIGIEHVANTKGLNPTPAQMCASAALVTWLCDTFGIAVDRTHILGHSEADTGTTHTGCPNAVWNWTYYMGLVTSRTCYPPNGAGNTAQALNVRALDGGADYPVQLIPQPDKNSCWAASMAMLYAFRRNMSLTPEMLANDVGASLSTSYGWVLLQAVRKRYGFEMLRQPDNTSLFHSPQQWADWLAACGPLWVVIVGAPHAVVLAGIRGTLSDPTSVQVKILNPWDTRVAFDSDAVTFNPRNNGYQDWLSFEQFSSDFGNMAEADYGNWRVLYLPAAAAGTQSLGRGGSSRNLSLRALNADPVNAPDATVPISDGEPIEPARVAGTVMRVLRGSAGASRYALDRLEGSKTPRSSTGAPVSATAGDVVIDLDDWPVLDGAATPLPIRIVFHHGTGGSVGQVHTEAGTPASPGRGVGVTARIEDAPDVGNLAALKIVVDYRFDGLAQASPMARTELLLLGDGRYERNSRWLMTAQAA